MECFRMPGSDDSAAPDPDDGGTRSSASADDARAPDAIADVLTDAIADVHIDPLAPPTPSRTTFGDVGHEAALR